MAEYVTGVNVGGVKTPIDYQSLANKPEWTLLYDGELTVTEPTTKIVGDLLVSCEGMTSFYGIVRWTANENTGTGNDNMAIIMGEAILHYGRFGDATRAGTSIFKIDVVGGVPFGQIATFDGVDPTYNSSNAKLMTAPIITKPDYEHFELSFFNLAYQGTITAKIYGK